MGDHLGGSDPHKLTSWRSKICSNHVNLVGWRNHLVTIGPSSLRSLILTMLEVLNSIDSNYSKKVQKQVAAVGPHGQI